MPFFLLFKVMKKLLLLGIFIVGALNAQAQARIGGNLVYGTEIEDLGIGVNGEFFIQDNLAVAPGFNYYFADDPVTFWEFNANVHYYFSESNAISVYALGGLNLAHIAIDFDSPFIDDRDDNELGVNLGIGANFDIQSSVTPFADFRFVLSDYDQAVFTFGLRFDLN